MSQSDKSWSFIHWHPAPGIPAVDIEPLDLHTTGAGSGDLHTTGVGSGPPSRESAPCPQCLGTGRGTGSDEYGWHRCECNGSGKLEAKP